MIGGQGEYTEHEMRHYLLRASHPYHPAAEFVFKSSKQPFYSRSFVVPYFFCGVEIPFCSPTTNWVYDGYMTQIPAVLFDSLTVLGRIHKIIEIRYKTGSH